MSRIEILWNNGTAADWDKALNEYYNAVMPNHVDIEKEMEHLDVNKLAKMNVLEFYQFLYEKYFYWKYTAANRLATTRMNLRKYITENNLEELEVIQDDIFSQSSYDILGCLKAVKQIKGLGIAGASGLLSLMYPNDFGTVDQFTIYSLREIQNLPEKNLVDKMNPNNITITNANILINIYRKKAKELNKKFNTKKWTPRKIDQVLWSIDRKN